MSHRFEYWEKTVEYAFVLAASRAERLDLALPLSGKPERAAGDAIFGSNASLVLVEFKRGKSQVENERSIFLEYEEAKRKLSPFDSHHFLVYPTQPELGTVPLKLIAETYFSRAACNSAVDCLAHGKNPKAFRLYLENLFSLKCPDGRSSSSQLGTGSLAQVLGVSPDGNLVEAVTLEDYAPDLFSEQDRESNEQGDTHVDRIRGG